MHHRGSGKGRDVPGVAETSQPLPVPPQWMWVSKLWVPVPMSIPVSGDNEMVSQQLALSSATPSAEHPLLDAGQGDILVPTPQKPPRGHGAGGTPTPWSSPASPRTAGPVAGNLRWDQKPVSYSRGI